MTYSLKSKLVTRRQILGSAIALAGGVSLSSLILSCGSNESSSGGDAPDTVTPSGADSRIGGRLRVALTGDPPNLDIHQTTDSIVVLVCSHMYETLFTWDAEYKPVPLLAESHDVLEDGMRHRVVLRDGVEFHNGETLTARDVMASIDRWSNISGLGGGLIESVAEIERVDDLTIDFHMRERYGAFRTALSRQLQGCAIYPESVLLVSTNVELSEYVGTGPYRFVEWLPDQHVRVERFENYRESSNESDGYAGQKLQYLDEVDFVPVRSEASRVAGMQANDYHFVESISSDQAPVLQGSPELSVDVLPADAWLNIVLNLRSPLLSDHNIRRAIQVALDHDQIMLAAVGEGFYELTPELVPGAPAWYSDAGSEYFNVNEPQEARRLLANAGYDGTPLRMMVTQEIQHEYNATLTMKQQLEAVGFTVDLQVLDGATLSDRRNDEEVWDSYTASASFRPDPVMRNLTSSATGWWVNDVKDDLFVELQSVSEFERRYEIWEQIQALFYEDVPRLKIGNINRLLARDAALNDIGPTEMQAEFSNAWFEA